MKEEWFDIKGYEGYYQINKKGQIKSLERVVPSRWGKGCTYHEKIMRTSAPKCRYDHVTLRRDNVAKGFSVHRLVAKTFIPNPENKPEINHKDGDRKNNSVENLEWCNASENALHALSLGLRKSVKGDRHGGSKLTELQAREIKYSKEKPIVLSKKFNISYGQAYSIQKGLSWKHI